MKKKAPTKLSDGHLDHLVPVTPIDVAAYSSVSDLLKELAHTSFGGRTVGEGADVLEAMMRDKQCFVVVTLSGAMTVAKQGLVLCEMIDRGYVNAIISTGALMAHGLVEGSGRTHFKYDPTLSDVDLYNKGYDRVYDTLELEQNLDDVDVIFRNVIDSLPEGTVLYSRRIMYELGKWLDGNTPKKSRAILKSAYKMNVPVFVPAFTDSELGLDFGLMNQLRVEKGRSRRPYDPFLDLESYARLLSIQKRAGILTIGGGVPRNWAQQLGPLMDLVEKRLHLTSRGFCFSYGVRVCPEPVHWGGLSGCTYSEGVSWGKFVATQDGGRYAEILADATIVWPLLVRGLIERLGDKPLGKKLKVPNAKDRTGFTVTARGENHPV